MSCTGPTRILKEVVEVARGLEGLRRQDSIHAAAVVISPHPLTDLVPVQRKGDDAEIVTQYEMYGIERSGSLKMDFLGLRNLSIIERTLELIKEGQGIDVDIDGISLDDQAAYDLHPAGRNGRRVPTRGKRAAFVDPLLSSRTASRT